MKWTLEFSKDADKFLKKQHHVKNDIISEIKKLIQKFNGETINIDVKKLAGNWEGYYRIRKGDIRIIFQVNIPGKTIFIDKIDFRGSVY